MSGSRYAICFAPEKGSALEALGQSWLGLAGQQPTVAGIKPERLTEITRGPRSYGGMHGTLKPSFELNPHATEKALLAVAHRIAASLAPIALPPLELREIGYIVSLVPETSSASLENLAAGCVRAFDGYRRPLTSQEEDSYRRNRLTVHQKQMLEHWGYPYVMEEFDFHVSLTDPIPDDNERMAVMKAVEKIAAPVLNKSLVMQELAVFCQRAHAQPMSIIARIPFGRRA